MSNLERLFRRVNEDFIFKERRLGFPNDWFRIVIRGRYRRPNRDLSGVGFPNHVEWETFNMMYQYIWHKKVQRFFQERLKRINKFRRMRRFTLHGDFFGRPIRTPYLDLWLVGREAMKRPVFKEKSFNKSIKYKRNRRMGERFVSDFFNQRLPHPHLMNQAYITNYSSGHWSIFLKNPWRKPHRLFFPHFLERGFFYLEMFLFPGEWSMRILLTRFFLCFGYLMLFACVCNFFYSIFFISVRNSYNEFRRDGLTLSLLLGPSLSAWIIRKRIKFSKWFFAIRYDFLAILRERRARQKKN